MVAGREVTPQDTEATARLKAYWTHGEGAALIAWGSPGDYDRCITNLGRFMTDDQLHGYCANLHHDALGIWPATHARLDREADGQAATKKAAGK
jgi:hypothetical protein